MKKLILICGLLLAVTIQAATTNSISQNPRTNNLTGALIPVSIPRAGGGYNLMNVTPADIIGSFDLEGDSITDPSNYDWARFFGVSIFAAPRPIKNWAVNGETAAMMKTEYPTEAHTTTNAHGVFVMLAGVNDIGGGANSNTVYTDLSNTWAQAKADGKTVVAVTIWPNFGWTDDKTNQIAGLNALIRAATNWDILADAGLYMTDADTLDHLHPTPAGAAKLNGIIVAAMCGVKAGYFSTLSVAGSGSFAGQLTANTAVISGSAGLGQVSVGALTPNVFSLLSYTNSSIDVIDCRPRGMNVNVGAGILGMSLDTTGNVTFNGYLSSRTALIQGGSGLGPVSIGVYYAAGQFSILCYTNSNLTVLDARPGALNVNVGAGVVGMALDASGNVTFPGTVTSAGVIATNAAGAKFKISVNATTNGLIFTPQ